MKTFDVPEFYRSPLITKIKEFRKLSDPRKKDFSPVKLDFGPVQFLIARHFGFCYGVENAIEISFKAIKENPGKRIFLLSQMIHNPEVNKDLQSHGLEFIMDTYGKQLISFDVLTPNDIVIIPAFGTTLAIEKVLAEKGVDVQKYNTTCPFVERVWKKSEKLGDEKYTIIIHGKHKHEETRATFSRSETHAPSIVLLTMDEAVFLGEYILGKKTRAEFEELFVDRISSGFDPDKDLNRVGVINQTTMLATETQAIADHFKKIMIQKYGEQSLKDHFSDTRDTLCYATNENQESTYALLKEQADLAIVVGGYNSSNTSHLVELCEEKLPTFFISSAADIESNEKINHFKYHEQMHVSTKGFLPDKEKLTIVITSGASCPDAVVEGVMRKLLSFYPMVKPDAEVMAALAFK